MLRSFPRLKKIPSSGNISFAFPSYVRSQFGDWSKSAESEHEGTRLLPRLVRHMSQRVNEFRDQIYLED
jgi:hypothetical protein